MTRFCSALLLVAVSTMCMGILAQELSADALAGALRSGGYVIVMRHASSPRTEPDAASAAPGNIDRERQLDTEGQETAAAMGEAIRRLAIPVAEVLSSPTFRALQTARLLDLGEAEPIAELGDGGQGMRRDDEGVRSAWLRAKAAEPVPAHGNRLIITHVPNLIGAFGAAASDMADGESLIIEPQDGKATVVARVTIAQWSRLAPGTPSR
jgi:phosphohistidine phosphatase SixA